MKTSPLYILTMLICVSLFSCTETATKLNKQALSALAVKNYDAAISLLQRAVALEPDNAQAYYLLGIGYNAKREFVKAISAYKKALDLNPKDVFTLCLLADVYLTKGMIDEAITVSRKAIALNPECQLGHYNLGIAYKKQGKNTIAARHLFEAGLLAFIDSNKNLAVKSYYALEEIGPTQTTQELFGLLEPLLTTDSKAATPSS
jgi:tetratricopeptide (TPR) repeat protein